MKNHPTGFTKHEGASSGQLAVGVSGLVGEAQGNGIPDSGRGEPVGSVGQPQRSCEVLCLQAAELKSKLLRLAEEVRDAQAAGTEPSGTSPSIEPCIHSQSQQHGHIAQPQCGGGLAGKRPRAPSEEGSEQGQGKLPLQGGEGRQHNTRPQQEHHHQQQQQQQQQQHGHKGGKQVEEKGSDAEGGEQEEDPNFVGKGLCRRRWRKKATLDQLQAAQAPLMLQEVRQLPNGELSITAHCPIGTFQGEVALGLAKFIPQIGP